VIVWGNEPFLHAEIQRELEKIKMTEWNINLDESKVRAYRLPEIFEVPPDDSETMTGAWSRQRKEIIRAFKVSEYGDVPDALPVNVEKSESSDVALGGLAHRRQFRLSIPLAGEDRMAINLLLYLPAQTACSRLFLGLNFSGNQTICDDPAIPITEEWIPNISEPWSPDHYAIESSRGVQSNRWPVEQILSQGWGIATAYYGDICPDDASLYAERLSRWPAAADLAHKPGAISLWAWGMSRIMDALEQIPEVDAKRVFLTGHSRLGKTALWGGALDERFSGAFSNDSGCGGASLFQRNFGESIMSMADQFPHWFTPAFYTFANENPRLPVDQHMLLALMAPRPLLVGSAREDLWADPKGEFLATRAASDLYRKLGCPATFPNEMPECNQRVGDRIGYHISPGKHDITPIEWGVLLDFVKNNRHILNDDHSD